MLVVVMAFAWGQHHVANLYRYREAQHHRTRVNNFFLVQRWPPSRGTPCICSSTIPSRPNGARTWTRGPNRGLGGYAGVRGERGRHAEGRGQRCGQGLAQGSLAERTHPGLRGHEGTSGPVCAESRLGASRPPRRPGNAPDPCGGGTASVDLLRDSVLSHLATTALTSNPEALSDAELAAAARGIHDDLFREEIAAIWLVFEQREPQGRTITDVAQAARAATCGAVHTLLVNIDEVLPGTLDDKGAVTFAHGPSATS